MNRALALGIGRLALGIGLLALAGCASTGNSGARVAGPVSPQAQAMFDQIKGLTGTWEITDENGQRQVGAVYRVVAAGSAVCEQMFPGSDHEMVNMYHLDGDRVLVTHYCALGNQPRMAAYSRSASNIIAFEPESVTNLPAPDTAYMAGLELELADANHLVQRWRSMSSGKQTSHAVFNLTRRGS